MSHYRLVECPEWQETANQICDHFGMDRIPIFWNVHFHRTLGMYRGTQIELKPDRTIAETKMTLIHELAHHLKEYYFKIRKIGYFKKQMRHKMISSCELATKKICYVSSGELEGVYFKTGTSHDWRFHSCMREIMMEMKRKENP